MQARVVYLCVAMLGLLLLSATGFYGGELVIDIGPGCDSHRLRMLLFSN